MKKTKIIILILAGAFAVSAMTACGPAEPENTPLESDQTETIAVTEAEQPVVSDTLPAGTTPAETTVATTEPILEADKNKAIAAAAKSSQLPDEIKDSSMWIFECCQMAGIDVPRKISEQAVFGTEIDFAAMEEGDLVFFTNDETGDPHFGGIYIGDGKMLYSTGNDINVKEADITTKYWNEHYVTSRRF